MEIFNWRINVEEWENRYPKVIKRKLKFFIPCSRYQECRVFRFRRRLSRGESSPVFLNSCISIKVIFSALLILGELGKYSLPHSNSATPFASPSFSPATPSASRVALTSDAASLKNN